MTTAPRNSSTYSWAAVIVVLFLFFPVGIYMLVKKVTTEKYAYAKNAKVMTILGWVLIGMGLVYLSGLTTGGVTTDGESILSTLIIIVLAFFGGGLALLINGRRFKQKGIQYSRYVSLVLAQVDGSIDAIAAAYPAEYGTVAEDLRRMIGEGFFPNAFVDDRSRRIVLPRFNAPPMSVNYGVAGDPAAYQPRAVQCPNCGATNKILPGVAGECEYCDSPL